MRRSSAFFALRRLATRPVLILGQASAFGFMLTAFSQTTPNGIWPSYAGGPQHQGISHFAVPKPNALHPKAGLYQVDWHTPVDLQPQYSNNELLTHYGSPLITRRNTVVLPVKTGPFDGFRVDGYRATDGLRLWSMNTDYSLPPHTWTPAMGVSLVGLSQVAVPGAGGTVYVRSNADLGVATVKQVCFYGSNKYRQNRAWCNLNIQICTPITSDSKGNMWFGFRVNGTPPPTMPPLKSGLARVTVSGTGTWVTATALAGGDTSFVAVPTNCTPALSPDSNSVPLPVVYVAVRRTGFGGMLVGVDAMTLQQQDPNNPVRATLVDPATNLDVKIEDASTASPTIGPITADVFGNPDWSVLYGALENPFASNNDRGWLFHFDHNLAARQDFVFNPLGTSIVGAFGWDDTVSIVPAYAVPEFTGGPNPSQFLICTKYNNYGDFGDGQNKVAILDPFNISTEPVSGKPLMTEVITILGPTHDPRFPALSDPRREWCINSAAIDPYSRCAIVNSEDGFVYRWDFASNTLSQSVQLTPGIGEAYTPTVIGQNGEAYAVNNATLFAIGSGPDN